MAPIMFMMNEINGTWARDDDTAGECDDGGIVCALITRLSVRGPTMRVSVRLHARHQPIISFSEINLITCEGPI